MRALHHKLRRDLWQIKGQVVAISLVIGVGVTLFIAYFSTFDSLRRTQETYYQRYRMADIFASLKRAPESLGGRIAEIPGVEQVATRVVADVTLDLEGTTEPITGRLVSMPDRTEGMMNGVAIELGRSLDPQRGDEVLINEGFALAHDLVPGDTLEAVINGRKRRLEITGIALSPEYVYTIRPGALMPDDARFGIVWMNQRALATAFDMEGAFNDVTLTLSPQAMEEEVIDRLDRLLKPYGGLGALPRTLQTSNWYLDNELRQLQGFGFFVPVVFLSVAIFLLNVVLTRIISVQREQIAALKALGYGDREVGWHYTQWSLLIAVLGGIFGVVVGRWMGSAMIGLYNDYFRFPFLAYELSTGVLTGALIISLLAAILGSWSAVRRAVALPPAEAMRPEPPADFRQTLLERMGLERFLSQPARIVLRNLGRRPARTAASIVGIAFSGGLLIIGLFFLDAIDELMDMQFNVVQRQEVTVNFVEPRGEAAFFEMLRLPGVLHAEPIRSVPVRLEAGHRSRQTAVTGVVDEAALQRVIDISYRPITLPVEGLVLSSKLAEVLAIEVGQVVTLEVLEGARPTLRVPVAALVDEYIGTSIYMRLDTLRRLLKEGDNLSGAHLKIDTRELDTLYDRLKDTPLVAGVALKRAAMAAFDKQMDQMMGVFIFFNILFASIIVVGVIYNAARIALSERSHELASMRVLGFTRSEISSILLGELAVITLLAMPLGLLFGYGLASMMVMGFDTELYRFPLVISPRSYAVSALVVLLASALCSLLVRRRLDHLDLVEVLKTKE